MMICRGILLTGYLFLFAGQFNCRYFTIANFYVYHNSATAAGSSMQAAAEPGATSAHTVSAGKRTTRQTPPLTLQDNTQRPAHLGIDKRFRFKQSIRIPEVRAPGAVYYPVVSIRFFTPASVCFSTDHPTTSLRGPPCA